jgi:hypothetical protein
METIKDNNDAQIDKDQNAEPSIEQALNRIFNISPELKRKFEIFMIQIIARNKLKAVTNDRSETIDPAYAQFILKLTQKNGIKHLRAAEANLDFEKLLLGIPLVVISALLVSNSNLDATILTSIYLAIITAAYKFHFKNFKLPEYIQLGKNDIILNSNPELAKILTEFYLQLEKAIREKQMLNALNAIDPNHPEIANIRRAVNDGINEFTKTAGKGIIKLEMDQFNNAANKIRQQPGGQKSQELLDAEKEIEDMINGNLLHNQLQALEETTTSGNNDPKQPNTDQSAEAEAEEVEAITVPAETSR